MHSKIEWLPGEGQGESRLFSSYNSGAKGGVTRTKTSVRPALKWQNKEMFRREFLQMAGTGLGLTLAHPFAPQTPVANPAADATLHISQTEIEIAAHKSVRTTAYNGSVPGPFLHFREGQRVVIDVQNDSNVPELVHWHGLFVPSEVDGSFEEGTPFIPPRGTQRYSFIARPAGTRWYHTHVAAKLNLSRGTYTGQFGMMYIEPRNEPGRYDVESAICLHGWEPYFTGEEEEEGGGPTEVDYRLFSING